MHRADPSGLSLNLDCSPINVPVAARRVAEFAATLGLGTQGCFEIRVVIAEAINNLIEHRSGWVLDRSVEIFCTRKRNALQVRIIDHGIAFGLPGWRDFPNAQAEHGRGWPIIARWTDRVDYRRLPDCNVLTLYRGLG